MRKSTTRDDRATGLDGKRNRVDNEMLNDLRNNRTSRTNCIRRENHSVPRVLVDSLNGFTITDSYYDFYVLRFFKT